LDAVSLDRSLRLLRERHGLSRERRAEVIGSNVASLSRMEAAEQPEQ
jgi:transcriptional regulator with XRE-family HTH domain